MSGTTCFWLEPTWRAAVYLRRYVPREGKGHYHDATSDVVAVREIDADGSVVISTTRDPADVEWDPTDERWPVECAEPDCGYEFEPTDYWQVKPSRLYERADTGEEIPLSEAPPGAMWDAHWMPSAMRGRTVDGLYLVVVLPNGRHWTIDGPASNCTRPDEEHDCWPRHGEPPRLTVDKNPEPGRSTCDAGAGSIGSDGWHGFLRDGVLA